MDKETSGALTKSIYKWKQLILKKQWILEKLIAPCVGYITIQLLM